ncbi:MAG: phosphate acetyltransferase [Candidatus Dasytiphilus stammeri]
MSRTIMLIPSCTNLEFTSVILGIIRAMEMNNKSIKLNFFTPITQYSGKNFDKTTDIICRYSSTITAIEPISLAYAESLIISNQRAVLMEEIIARCYEKIPYATLTIVAGMIPTYPFANLINYEMANALNAEIIFIISLDYQCTAKLKKRIELIISSFDGNHNPNLIGVIINKLHTKMELHFTPCIYNIFNNYSNIKIVNLDLKRIINQSPLPVLGYIPWKIDLIAIRAIEVCQHLNARIINKGDIVTRRIKSIMVARDLPDRLEQIQSGSLIITSAYHPVILITACLAAKNLHIGAILITDGMKIDKNFLKSCKFTMNTGIPVFMVKTSIWQTCINLHNLNLELTIDDKSRIEYNQEYIARYINVSSLLKSNTEFYKIQNKVVTPTAFRYQITERARQIIKKIVLPEGDEPRTLRAAAICTLRKIAHCVLLGDPKKITHMATMNGININKSITIIDPTIIRQNYVHRLFEIRKNKGMTEAIACKQLEDNVVLGTMMLEKNEVDGLVSGARHTTANTIRPSLQIIQNNALVSSIFFMLLPKQVLVYGDCAINRNPTAEQLAEIAIQSAESAILFGIEPRVAMISYATGNSSDGNEVDKVRQATQIAQMKRQDLMIDGPLQYDAAISTEVARFKAPNSPVAGNATVLIFPDLNTGNTTYKAVQRTANLISIGPILQGINKPVNDLSRGALVDDIIYTIAITAIQSLSLIKR